MPAGMRRRAPTRRTCSEIALDKPEYVPGDSMTVAVTARTAGKVTLNVIGDRLITTVTQDVTARHRAAARPGRQRLGHRRLCGRDPAPPARCPAPSACPAAPSACNGSRSTARRARSRSTWACRRCCGRTGRCASRSRSTGSLPARRRASSSPRSMSASSTSPTTSRRRPTTIISASAGSPPTSAISTASSSTACRARAARSGPAATPARAELQGSPPTQKPLALYSGIVAVKPDGTAEIAFDIPDFAGTARVMAVAWRKDKVGRAIGDVIIRDPVVLTATLPRFLLNGDRGTMHLDLDNVEGQAGDYRLEVRSEGVNVGGSAPQTLRLNAKQRSSVTLPLSAAAAGAAAVIVRVSGPGGFALERNYRAQRAAGDPDPRPPHGQAAGQGRKPHALERPVRRSRAGQRERRAVGRSSDRARCGGAADGARPLPVRLLGADRQPRAAAALRQRSGGRGASGARHRGRSAHPRLRSTGCWRVRAPTARSDCGRPAATTSGSMPTSPTS